jgi:hypothetical protein
LLFRVFMVYSIFIRGCHHSYKLTCRT